jgi:hypothetical protein
MAATESEMKVKKDKKLTLSIEQGLNRRLDIQAALDGKGHDRSSILDGLVKQHIERPDDVTAFMVDAPKPQATEVKASGSQPVATVTRSKTTYYLSFESDRVLRLHALLTRQDLSPIVEGLIRAHVTPWDIYDPREFHLTSRRKDRQGGARPISSSERDAA